VTLAFALSVAYDNQTNQSLKNWTGSTSYMHESFVDLLRESVSESKVATRLRLIVCWHTSEEACTYEKGNHHNGGHHDFLLNCKIGRKKHTADLALIASRFLQALSQKNFTSKW